MNEKNSNNLLDIGVTLFVSVVAYFLYKASGWELRFETDKYLILEESIGYALLGMAKKGVVVIGFNNALFGASFGIISTEMPLLLIMSNKFISSYVIIKYLACILPFYFIYGPFKVFGLLFCFDFSGKNDTHEKNQSHEINELKQNIKELSGAIKGMSQESLEESTDIDDDLLKNDKKFIVPNDKLDKKKTDEIVNKIKSEYVNAANQVVIIMPALGSEMEEGWLSKWLVKEGDSVSCGDLIAEVETDKVIMEIETSYNGIIGKILVNEGQDSIKINEPIAILLLEDKTWHRDFLILHRNGLYVVKEKSFKSLDNAKTYIDTFLNES